MDILKLSKSKSKKAKIMRSAAMNNDIESQIVKIAQDIRQSKINVFSNPDYHKQYDVMKFIQYILVKRSRTKEDREVLIEFLKSLEKFMSLIANECSSDLGNEMMMRVSKSLQLQEASQGSILFRTGEKGSIFYILIKGSVSVLIPTKYKLHMTPDEYLEHLCFLNQVEEFELQEKTATENKEVYHVNISNPANPKIVNFVNKHLEYYTKREVEHNTVDEYIKLLEPHTATENNTYYPQVTVYGYHKIINLIQGNTFGETALLSKNQKRTATIYSNEDSVFGILNELDFNMSLKTIQIQIKRDRVLFVMSFNIFNSLSFEYFIKKYWNNFTYLQLKQGDVLFQQNSKRELVYFMKNGEIELTSRLSIVDINKIIRSLGDKSILENSKLTINQAKKYKITCVKNVSIIGLDDLVYNKDQYFCTATCLSKKAELFALETKMMKQIIDDFKKHKELEAIIAEKVEVMYNRLKTFQQIDNFILEKEPYSVIKEKVLPAFSKKEFTQKLIRPLTSSSCSKEFFPILAFTHDRKHAWNKENIYIEKKKRSLAQYDSTPIDKNQNKDRTVMTKQNDSLFSSRLLPYHTLNANYTDGTLNTDKSSFFARGAIKKTTHEQYNDIANETHFTRNNKNHKSKNKTKQTIENTFFDSDEKEFDYNAKIIPSKMSLNAKQKRLVYSNLTLNPDFTIKTSYNIFNVMDYCLMEENKSNLTNYFSENEKKPKKQIKELN